ncbi:hypothetical protein BKA67DRAFT_542520 [Truncatella angustata]|uniref:Ester cyclase n=1 Tax=Truncatella angustata TaxID=152316 RepID=A0A9P8RJT2_9PEZI|nr:uncharacterized protein BKA67DRAFT_542520 [Truncatella angustata]KAH6639990.1 hypothetical protein BKA67DRAFT_542520 [Truncatella angustata]
MAAGKSDSADAVPQSEQLNKRKMIEFYNSYIRAINEGPSEAALSRFVRPEVTHNSKGMPLSRYISLITDTSVAFHDMLAHIVDLLVDEELQLIAAKIEWSGTLITPLRGVEPNGQSTRFSEMVHYQLESGLIAQVWSVVDWDSFASQTN